MGEESACNAGAAGGMGSIPGSGRSSGGVHGHPAQYSCLENPHGQRSLVGYSPWSHKELDVTDTTERHGGKTVTHAQLFYIKPIRVRRDPKSQQTWCVCGGRWCWGWEEWRFLQVASPGESSYPTNSYPHDRGISGAVGDTLVRIPEADRPFLLDHAKWKGGPPGKDRPAFISVWVTSNFTPSMPLHPPPAPSPS